MSAIDAMSNLSERNSTSIDPKILKEAAAWLTQLHGGSVSQAQQLAWQRWRETSPEHARAWARAEQLLGKISVIPAEFTHTLDRPKPVMRRQFVKALGAAVVVGPLAWFGYRQVEQQSGWAYYTAVGERRTFALKDGAAIALNTDSAVKIDYSEQHRQIRLVQGEMFVSTQAALKIDQRPLTVATEDGWLRMQDCQCNVRRHETHSEVSVLSGMLELTLVKGASRIRLSALQRVSYSGSQVSAVSQLTPEAFAWRNGVIDAESMRLDDFIAELGRYRPGLLVCEPAVGDLRISGVFQLDDTDKILAVLQNTLPVAVVYRTAYWIIVAPRRSATTPLRT
jgi:transmembrane sensor